MDLYFDIGEMHGSDLYLILFSYLKFKQVFCYEVLTLAKSKTSFKFFSSKTSFDISKMSYREFENWWEHRQWYDSILLEEKDVYGVRLTFVPELVEIYIKKNNISLESFYDSFRPNFPWSTEIINIFNYFIDPFNEYDFWDKSHMYKFYGKKKPNKH